MEHDALSKAIIGCAYRVYNIMGFGFLESVYEKCLLIELKKSALKAETQQPITVKYNDIVVGDFLADIIVNNQIIIELKSVKRIVNKFEQQLVNYLTATNINVGLIINFAEQKVEIKRKVRTFC